MTHHTTRRFRGCLSALPEQVQNLAQKSFALLFSNPAHPSLQFKKVGTMWSVRVGIAHRALAIPDGEDYIWVWIGTHEDCEDC